MLVLLVDSERGSAVVPLRDGEAVIGRGEDCNLIVEDGLMSRRHARFRLEGDVFTVEDLRSTNGVYVNGQRITQSAVLHPGDLVLVGGSKLRVESRGASVVAPAHPSVSMRALGRGSDRAKGRGSDRAKGRGSDRAKARTSVTARPPPARPEADATGVARRAQVLELLAGLAAKALGQGRPEQAEQILSPALHQFLGEVKSKRLLPASDAERACGHALRLAAATGKGEWVNYIVELYAVEPRPLPGSVIDDLLNVVRKVAKIDLQLLRHYLDALRSSAESLSAGDRFLLQRLETFERVAATR